jgi:hypothetical protein
MLVWIVGGALAWLVSALGCGMLIGRMFSLGASTPSKLLPLAEPASEPSAWVDRRRGPTVPLPLSWERRALAEPRTTGTQRRRRLSA